MLKSLTDRLRAATARFSLNLVGRWRYLRSRNDGDLESAWDTFHRLLDVDGASFSAHYHLGQIARTRGHARLAFDHFLAAYRSNSARFERSSLPDDLKNHVALRHGLSRSPLLLVREPDEAALSREERSSGPQTGFQESADEAAAPAGFRTAEEARRLRRLPPLTAEEVSSVDMELLISRLQRDE